MAIGGYTTAILSPTSDWNLIATLPVVARDHASPAGSSSAFPRCGSPASTSRSRRSRSRCRCRSSRSSSRSSSAAATGCARPTTPSHLWLYGVGWSCAAIAFVARLAAPARPHRPRLPRRPRQRARRRVLGRLAPDLQDARVRRLGGVRRRRRLAARARHERLRPAGRVRRPALAPDPDRGRRRRPRLALGRPRGRRLHRPPAHRSPPTCP